MGCPEHMLKLFSSFWQRRKGDLRKCLFLIKKSSWSSSTIKGFCPVKAPVWSLQWLSGC